jgi:hypothetical protein
MNRKTKSKSCGSTAAMLSVGVILGGPLVSAQGLSKVAPPAQKAAAADRKAVPFTIKFAGSFLKWGSNLSVAGMLDRRPVFKNAQGEFFQVDPATGDLKFHSPDSLGYIKIGDIHGRTTSPGANFIKFDGIKGQQRVSVAGVDALGNVIQENNRGERFYLGPNGDMVFVK